jgi:integrase
MGKKRVKVWFDTPFPGVRFRKHPTRKHGVKRDSYFQVRYQKDGRRVEEALGWASEGMSAQKAALQLAKLREAARTGEGETSLRERRVKAAKARAEKEAGEITFAEFWTKTYFPHAMAEKTKDTLKRERSLFTKWLNPLFGPLPFGEISVLRLERLKSEMSKAGLSARSAQYGLAVTRQVINEARRRGTFAADNPVRRVRSPKVDNRRLRFLTPEEADTLLTELSKTDRAAWEMALLSLYAGLRAGEILKLTWGNIDTRGGLITVKDSKSGRTRFAYMTETVRMMLEAKTPGDPEALVYPGPGGLTWPEIPRTFNEAVDKLRLNEGRTDRRDRVVFHSLRHTFASWLVQRGVDIFTVKEALGHRTLVMATRYAHLAPGSIRKAVQVLEAGPNEKAEGKERTAAHGAE